MNEPRKEKAWKKTLYENCGYPDNYTDETFLVELRKNIRPNDVSVLEAVRLSASISLRISIIVLFVLMFVFLNENWTSPNIVFIYSSIVTVGAYFYYLTKTTIGQQRLSNDVRTVLIYLAFSYILSPVLKTLTETISTNTIYNTTTFMFLMHLIFCRYGSPQMSLSDSLSINSSIFASLMLASRLTTPLHAFTLLTVAVQFFVLLPFLLSRISVNLWLSVGLMLINIYFVATLNRVIAILYFFFTAFIHVVCPVFYVRWHKYKDNIYGPWDEAIIIH